MTIRNFFLPLLSFWLFTCVTLGQTLHTGRVVDLNGQGIADVTVTVAVIGTNPGPISPTTCASKTGVTDTQGNYSVEQPIPFGGSSCQNRTTAISYSKMGFAFQSLGKPDEIFGVQNGVLTLSGASFDLDRRTIAGDMVVSLFGIGLASGIAAATSADLPTTLAGISVVVRDRTGVEKAARLFYVSPTQINLLVPTGLSEGPGAIVVRQNTTILSGGFLAIGTLNPSFFTANQNGRGVAAAVVQRHKLDGRFLNYEPVEQLDAMQNLHVPVSLDFGPTDENLFLTLFGTGIRARSSTSTVKAKIDGVDAEVVYAGAQLVYPGLDQVNILLPRSLTGRGTVDVVVTIEDSLLYVANPVQIRFR